MGGPLVSVIFEAALAEWRAVRADYGVLLEAQHRQASRACNGALLNRRGRAAGIDSASLFLGPWARARCYASAELLEWWREHPRVTFAQFEVQTYEPAPDQLPGWDAEWETTAHGR